MRVRAAHPDDAARIAEIYNAGVQARSATFRTQPQESAHFAGRIGGEDAYLVCEIEGEVIGAAWTSPYSDASPYYAGVREATVYVGAAAQRGGAGRALLEALSAAAAEGGRHKLVAKVFTTNEPSVALFRSCGYREVGIHRSHGRLDGAWKDVLLLELSLTVSSGGPAPAP